MYGFRLLAPLEVINCLFPEEPKCQDSCPEIRQELPSPTSRIAHNRPSPGKMDYEISADMDGIMLEDSGADMDSWFDQIMLEGIEPFFCIPMTPPLRAPVRSVCADRSVRHKLPFPVRPLMYEEDAEALSG